MKKSIAIIELYQHDEVLRHYCEMLRDSGYNIKVFCSKVVYDCMEDFHQEEQFDWEVQNDEESIPSFLKKHRSILKSFDLVFITTILSNYKAFYKVVKANKTLLLIHNVHSFLDPVKYMIFEKPIEDRIRKGKLVFERAHFYKKEIIKLAKALAFPTERILEYTKAHFDLPDHLSLMSLPFVYLKEEQSILKDEIITITIPGTISTELRNYKEVLNAFIDLEQRLTEKIRLVFLGRSNKEKVTAIDSFFDLNKEKIELITFENFILPSVYESWLLKTDFLILPFKPFGRNYIYSEHVGYSKISGSINDMIRYGIPALLPDYYPLEAPLDVIVEKYKENKLTEKLASWIKNKTFLEMSKSKTNLLEDFGLEKRRTSLLNKINSLF